MSQKNGKIKFFNASRGFGFITPEDGGKDIFFHITALEKAGIKEVQEGMQVAFDVGDDPRGRGKQATNLRIS